MEHELNQKYEKLRKIILQLGNGIVAFSGGVDSTLILKVARDLLGNNVIAATADSPSLPRKELEETKKIASKIGAKHIIINTQETSKEEYLKNPSNRCYYCKTELYSELKKLSQNTGIKNIINGTNYDDIGDFRPGLEAADESKILSPLKDAKLTKNDVRALAKHLGLDVWDKPSSPCLSSRVPYGQEITLKKLAMIEEAEHFLKDFGIKELRVRHFGDEARIDVNESSKRIVDQNFIMIKEKFQQIGFKSISTADFKSGSLNLMINVRAAN